MNERGAALVEALIVALTAGVIGAVAMQAIADLPDRAAEWEEAAAARQRLRTFESRLARLISRARPIQLDVGGTAVRIPAVWPRRLGLWRPGAPLDLAATDVTLLSRPDGHRTLTLTSALAGDGGDTAVSAGTGCGLDVACGVRPGDFMLAVTSGAACGLYRVISIGARWSFAPLMQAGATAFPPGSVIVPVEIDALSFVAGERALRRYDGYRSDNVMIDGLRSVTFSLRPADGASLGDGPFVGAGSMAYDVDQLQVRSIRVRVALEGVDPAAFAPGASYEWRVGGWR